MVNESKNMYIPEDTLENHQGNVFFDIQLFSSCVSVCVDVGDACYFFWYGLETECVVTFSFKQINI